MTEEQVMLVKNSWKTFRKVDANVFGDLFYSKLFIDNPKLEKMFTSIEQQRRKLVDMLSYIVARLDKPEMMINDIQALALRHQNYGVKQEHYQLVGDALLWTLKRGMGNNWTREINDAWLACYNMIASTMIAATQKEKHINQAD